MVEKLVEKLVWILCRICYTTGYIRGFIVSTLYAIPALWEAYKVGRRIQKCGSFSEEEIDDIAKRLTEKYQKKAYKALGL